MSLKPAASRHAERADPATLQVDLRIGPAGWSAELSFSRHARKLHFATLHELRRYLARLGRARPTRGLR